MDKRYQVFISSTFTDLKEERKAIIEGLLNAKYIPAGMEMFTASNDEQFKYIKKIIDTCDYYVLIVGARYGSINPSTGKSFTEQEYDYAVEKGIPVLAFLHDDPYNLPVEKRDDKNREQLEQFRNKVSDRRLCKMWHTSTELIASVIISLGEEVADNPQTGWIRGNIEDFERKYRELREKYNEMIRQKDHVAPKCEGYTLYGAKTECVSNGYDIRTSHLVTKKITLTWGEIFSAIGSYLTVSMDFIDFKDYLEKSINFVYNTDFSFLNYDCVQTVKDRLDALGLIKCYQVNLVKGGSAEGIVITEKGSRYLSELKTIKR